ncbi:MAG: transcriptional repressor [Bacteroidales bacterium]|nr:transcriptional repressor [Bacteroidales bacterium]
MSNSKIISVLKDRGLKVTPQRIAVLDALYSTNEHPSAEKLIDIVRRNNPHIAKGTIYKILDFFIESGLVKKVHSAGDRMRYDAFTERHHHLYSLDTDRIEDYHDEELNAILEEYFKKRSIPHFRIEDIQLHIKGKFIE